MPLCSHAQDAGDGQHASGDEDGDAQGAGASGDGGEDEARDHFRLGRVYYEGGRFAEAAREFEQAYALSGRPELLYNLFLARRDAGEIDKAIPALEQYLELAPEVENRSKLEARLRAMRRLSDERGDDGSEPSEAPQTGRGEGQDGDMAAVGQDGEEGDGSAPPSRPAPDVEGSGPSVVPWIVAGAGGALLVGGVATGVLALNKESDLGGRCARVAPDMYACDPGFENDKSKGAALANATDVLVASGLAAVGVGVALFFLLDDGGASERASASVGCDGHGCAGSVRLAF